MGEPLAMGERVRNVSTYLFGVGLAVIGALGLAGAIELAMLPAGAAFCGGILVVIAVHEFLGGPV